MTAMLVGALAVAAAVLAIGTLPLGRLRIPRIGRHPDEDVLADAGWQLSLLRWECLRALIVIAGLGLAHALALWPAAGVAIAVVPSVAVRVHAHGARDRARASVTQVLLSAHAMLRSGIALPEALRRAAAGCEDRLARGPFDAAIERFDLGDPLDEAIRAAVAASADRRLVATFHTLALGVTERLPIHRAASLLEAMTERAIYDQRLDAEVRARTAGVRLQSHLLAAIVPALALYLVATMPGLGATLGSALGRTVLIPLAGALEIAGIVVSRRVVHGISR